MSAGTESGFNRAPEPDDEMTAALTSWLAVSGDVDDFIFYGDTSREHSEK